MMDNFSKASIIQKQEQQREEYRKKKDELRKCIQQVGNTESGEMFLRYLFLLTGGNTGLLRRDANGKIDEKEMLSMVSVKSVWEHIRADMDSDMIKKIERWDWETN